MMQVWESGGYWFSHQVPRHHQPQVAAPVFSARNDFPVDNQIQTQFESSAHPESANAVVRVLPPSTNQGEEDKHQRIGTVCTKAVQKELVEKVSKAITRVLFLGHYSMNAGEHRRMLYARQAKTPMASLWWSSLLRKLLTSTTAQMSLAKEEFTVTRMS